MSAGDRTGPGPKPWKTPKLMYWLNDNPGTEDEDVDFLIKMVTQRKTLATYASAARKRNEEALDDWKGKKHVLQMVEALVQNDFAKRAFLSRQNIDPGHHAVDVRNSVEKHPDTVREMISDWQNDPVFNPATEIVNDLHSEFLVEINLSYEHVASMHEATPEYIEQQFQGMMVVMKHGIANWELSGMGDGGRDQDCDDDDEPGSGYCKGHKNFGSIRS